MTTFAVRLTGHDRGTGSVTQPLCTIAKAAQMARGGDQIMVGRGTYYEPVRVFGAGTPEQPIVFTSEGKHQAIISASVRPQGPWNDDGGSTR